MSIVTVVEPKHRKAVRVTPQLNELKKVKKTRLPPIQASFDVRVEAGLNPKAKAAWETTEAYVAELVKYHNLLRAAPRSQTSEQAPETLSKADLELEESLKKIYAVRDRCIHSLAYPQMYVKQSKPAQNELYLYWVILSEFRVDSGCEYYSIKGGEYSRFFMTTSRYSLETSGLEYEYYSMLKRFANMFHFDSDLDRNVFGLFLDGFDPIVISDLVGEPVLWVKKKLEQLKSMAEASRSDFLKLSELEMREIIEEYREELGLEEINAQAGPL